METLTYIWESLGEYGYAAVVGILLLIAGVWQLGRSCRKIMRRRNTCEEQKRQGVSVIITSHNNAEQLEKNLPYFLTQDYEDYEVIVVDECSEDDTETVLGRLADLYHPRLRCAKIPRDAKFRSTKKLAINIGVLAAKYDVLLFSEANCCPASREWVREMQACFTEKTAVVVGFANYEADEASRRVRFFRAWRFMKMLAGNRGDGKIMGDGCNMAYRKSDYLKNRGFRHSQSYLGYDSDMVKELAKFGTVVVAKAEDAYMIVKRGRSRENEVMYQCACEMVRPWGERLIASCYQMTRVLLYSVGICLARVGFYPLIVGCVLAVFLMAEFVAMTLCLRHLKQKRLSLFSLLMVMVGVFYVWGLNICLLFTRKRWK